MSGPVPVAVANAVKTRAKRPRRERTFEDRLFELALQRWLEWLLQYHLPRATQVTVSDAGLADTWAMVLRSSRSNTEHSDSVLGAVLAEERSGADWPSSIHCLVLEFPKAWQFALIGIALGRPQREIAEAVGIRQQNVSVLVDLVRSRFLPALLMISSTERVCRSVLGVERVHLRLR